MPSNAKKTEGPGRGGKRPGAGRKALPDNVRERFLMHLRAGMTPTLAAGLTGIGRSTAYMWMAEPGFAEQTEMAIDAGRAKLLARIAKAGRDPRLWTANAWMLERTAPQEFGRLDRIVIDRAREEYARDITERLMTLPPDVARAALAAIVGKPAEIEGEIVSEETVHE